MKKYFKIFLLVFALGLMFLVGCGPKASAQINIAGSTSVQPLAEVLAEEYMKKNPSVVIDVQGGGSSAGIEAVTQGVVAIGMSSRPLKDEEKILLPYEIAYDAIAIIVNPKNSLKAVKIDQLKKIYDGQFKKWADILPQINAGEEIDVVTREEGSGTRDAFSKIVMGENDITSTAIVQDATGVVREIVATDPKAIGYISLGIANERVKVLKINGVIPSLETVTNHQYKLSRPFLFVFKVPPQGEIKKFLNFILGAEGQKIVRHSGFVPTAKAREQK